jgi:subtilisin family serine protease
MPSVDLDGFQNVEDYIEFELKHFLSYPVDCLKLFIENLGNNPHIIRLSLKTKPKVLNHVSRGITQSGKSFNEPYSLAGLNGTNQTVGIADSGLNDLSCFYYDHNYKNTTPRQLLGSDDGVSSLTIDRTRRKVIQYVYNLDTDKLDDEGGHGTHCAGSIAGNCLGDGNMNGMAPEAKLAFYDIGLNGEDSLSISPSLTAILQTAFNAGARIHSNSWGNDESIYGQNSRAIDDFQYKNPFFYYEFRHFNSEYS